MQGVLIAIQYCLGLLAGGLWGHRVQLVPVLIPGMPARGRDVALHRVSPSFGWRIVYPELGTFGRESDRWLSVLALVWSGGGQWRGTLRHCDPPRSRI